MRLMVETPDDAPSSFCHGHPTDAFRVAPGDIVLRPHRRPGDDNDLGALSVQAGETPRTAHAMRPVRASGTARPATTF